MKKVPTESLVTEEQFEMVEKAVIKEVVAVANAFEGADDVMNEQGDQRQQSIRMGMAMVGVLEVIDLEYLGYFPFTNGDSGCPRFEKLKST